MRTLVSTLFFKCLNDPECSEDLNEMYHEFVERVFDLCTRKSCHKRLMFILNYTTCELKERRALGITNPKVLEAINKSILFLDETTQYVREIRDQYPRSEDGVKSSHRWSGKTTDLVELVYALHNSRCIDEGNITIEQLSEYVGRIFGVEMKNKYITYSEIKRRGKDSRTYFLDRLSAGLNEKMAEDDAI